MFLWRVLKDKRLKIRSFLADPSNVHRDKRQRIFNVQISNRSLNTILKTEKMVEGRPVEAGCKDP
ncbi:hypothetical protein Taro_033087 [Colocasia esculenta]|uniref:Uncharacterized protein n=1 Tax=Colocasia esculenta TaxID=4460 RepID=A0A843WBF1_COLES|nr:hypothetical protein [Colocasia esculenta]